MEDQLSTLHNDMTELKGSVDKLTQLLAGDEFGREGMLAKQTRNHHRISRLEDAHKKLTWLGGLGTLALGVLIAFKEEIKSIFTAE